MTLPVTSPNERPRRRLGTLLEVQRDFLPLSKSTLYDGFRDRRIPGAVKVGRRLLIDLDQLEAWIDAGGGATE